jgi:hypothetical protein
MILSENRKTIPDHVRDKLFGIMLDKSSIHHSAQFHLRDLRRKTCR